jgi:hypothetical protein
MADETQNPATKISSGASDMLSGLLGAIATSAKSWRGLIALFLVLTTILLYAGKLTPQQIPTPVKQDNSELLSSVANIRKDIADLKAHVTSSVGELSEKMETLKVTPVAPTLKPRRPKNIQASTGDPKGP